MIEEIMKIKKKKLNNSASIPTQSPQTLQMVLKYLEENDEYFECNVPEKYRDPEEDDLQEFLLKTYLNDYVKITGEENVKKHIKKLDFVEFCMDKPDINYNFYIKPEMRGIIKKVNTKDQYPITVLWESCDEMPNEKTLKHEAENLILLPNKKNPEDKITDALEILATAKPRMTVHPKKEYYDIYYHLPPGAIGIVESIDEKEDKKYPIRVLFGDCEGHIPTESGFLIAAHYELNVFKKNKIDIVHLLTEKKYLN